MQDCKTRLEEWTERSLFNAFSEFKQCPTGIQWENLETAMLLHQQAFQDVRSDDRKKSSAAKAVGSLGEILAWSDHCLRGVTAQINALNKG
tara:strand:- start:489 stop:761 length:273 start_codon:yes stop_codon:yes gene_type:complete